MNSISYGVFARLSRPVNRLKRIHDFLFRAGQGQLKYSVADAARTGRLVCEMPQGEPAMREIAALATEIERITR
jgi:hypothetical protein